MRNKRGLLQIFKTCSTKYLLKNFHVVQKTKYTKQNPPKMGVWAVIVKTSTENKMGQHCSAMYVFNFSQNALHFTFS